MSFFKSPLSQACCDKDETTVRSYISSLPADKVFKVINHGDGLCEETPLMLAAIYGRHEIVSYLLEKGARKDIANQQGTAFDQTKIKHDQFVEMLGRGISSTTGTNYANFVTDETEHGFIMRRDNLARVLEILEAHQDPTVICVVCRSPRNIHNTCSVCHVPIYCSRECQRVEWKRGHKQTCAAV